MGKEQDFLVAVKSGDILLAHKLLAKVKCNKTSEYLDTHTHTHICFLFQFLMQPMSACVCVQSMCICWLDAMYSRSIDSLSLI